MKYSILQTQRVQNNLYWGKKIKLGWHIIVAERFLAGVNIWTTNGVSGEGAGTPDGAKEFELVL